LIDALPATKQEFGRRIFWMNARAQSIGITRRKARTLTKDIGPR